MARVTVRVDDDLKERMDEHDEINWSEFIRESIRQRLSTTDRRQIQNLVETYEGDRTHLFSLYMFAERIDKQRIYETMERLFGEEQDEVVDQVERDISERHITRMYERTPNGEQYGDLIIDEIEAAAGEAIRNYVRNRIAEASEPTKTGISLLPHFVRDRRDDDGTSIKEESLARTWALRSGREVNPDLLLSTGLVFSDYYSSNAYSYATYRVPGYAIDIIDDLERHPTQFEVPISHPDAEVVDSLKQTTRFNVFLDWMDGMTKYVPKHGEDDDIREFLSDRDLSMDEFEEVRKQLVENNMLVLEYRPHRSSAGGRDSSPARWKYRFTEPAQQLLAKELT